MRVNILTPVAGGCFLITDYEEYSELFGGDTKLPISKATLGLTPNTFQGPSEIEVDPGYYTIQVKFIGVGPKLPESVRIHIPSGKILVADMCHVINPHKWTKFLEETDCLTKFRNPARTKLISTAENGAFTVNLNIELFGGSCG